jgi:hypothetical protein
MAGIDIGVHRSGRRTRVGRLNRQGSPSERSSSPTPGGTGPLSPWRTSRSRGSCSARAGLSAREEIEAALRRALELARETEAKTWEPAVRVERASH